MKTIWVFLLIGLSGFLVSGQTNSNFRLAGIVDGFGMKRAFLERTNQNSRREQWTLSEGQAMNGVSMLKIDPASQRTTIMRNGAEEVLPLGGDGDTSSKKPAPNTSLSLHLVSVDLSTAIEFYAGLKERTALRHPLLPNYAVSISANPKTEAEAAMEFERSFAEHGITAIPDGEHFVMLVPTSLTNQVAPNSDKIATNGRIIPSSSVNFRTVPLSMVLPVYADCVNRKIINEAEAPPAVVINLVQQTPLSMGELCYAMETLFAWNHVRLLTNDDNTLKIERLR